MIDKNILITGGAGFIGSNICYKLYENNNVSVIDNLSTGNIENIKELVDKNKITFFKNSINDYDFLKKVFTNVDYVLHQAAIPSVPRSVADPISSNEANITGTLKVLMAARDSGVKKLVFASSSSVYGDTPTLPKKEDMSTNPLSPYAITKLAAEKYCEVFTDLYDLDTVSLRYFNVYGPRQDPKSQYAAVVPKFIKNVQNNKPPVIYGDGEQTRGFTFVDDVVQANIKSLESNSCGVYNISGGYQTTVNELAEIISDLYDFNKDFIYDSERPGDIKHSYADISNAEKYINYKPHYDLKEGLEITKEWYDERNNK